MLLVVGAGQAAPSGSGVTQAELLVVRAGIDCQGESEQGKYEDKVKRAAGERLR